jgi:hypothetical protein
MFMNNIMWTVGGTKADLENLLKEIRQFESQNGGKLIPDDSQPRRLPSDPDAPMGQLEWYEVVLAIATSAVGSGLYEGIKAQIKKHVAAKPNQATFTETKQDQ